MATIWSVIVGEPLATRRTHRKYNERRKMYYEGLEGEKERSSAAEELASLILRIYKENKRQNNIRLSGRKGKV